VGIRCFFGKASSIENWSKPKNWRGGGGGVEEISVLLAGGKMRQILNRDEISMTTPAESIPYSETATTRIPSHFL
jgi:hypothetical protein